MAHGQARSVKLDVIARDRKLDALVLADRTAEHLALLGIVRRPLDEPAAIADTFGGNQDALGIHAVENVAKTLVLLADERVGGNFEIVEEDFRRRVVDHRRDRRDPHLVLRRRLHVDDEDRQPVRARGQGALGRRAGEEDHEVGMLGAAGPDLLAVDDIGIAALLGRRRDRQRIGARARFGDAERLQAQFAARDPGQVFLLLRLAAMPQQRAHRVHLGVARGPVGAGGMDFGEDRRRSTQGQAAASIFRRDQRGKQPGFGHRGDELGRVLAGAVDLAPIGVGKTPAQRARRLANGLEVVVGNGLNGIHRSH